jgi:hypothetical protein
MNLKLNLIQFHLGIIGQGHFMNRQVRIRCSASLADTKYPNFMIELLLILFEDPNKMATIINDFFSKLVLNNFKSFYLLKCIILHFSC